MVGRHRGVAIRMGSAADTLLITKELVVGRTVATWPGSLVWFRELLSLDNICEHDYHLRFGVPVFMLTRFLPIADSMFARPLSFCKRRRLPHLHRKR